MTDHPRYAGKPLLRLLELYVLSAIDALKPEEASNLKAMAPKLTALYGGDGSWQDAVASSLHLPPHMPDMVREMWDKNTEIAKTHDVTLEPQDFAEMFVDSNLWDDED